MCTLAIPIERARVALNDPETMRCFYECQVVIGRGWVAVRSRKSSRLM
jgi:hypothetical protein